MEPADKAVVRVAPRPDRLAQLGSLDLLDSRVSLEQMARATPEARTRNRRRRADVTTRAAAAIRPALRVQALPGRHKLRSKFSYGV